jgi:hypothetical protein
MAKLEDPKVIKVLQSFGESYSFNVEVHEHHGGVWQLERVAGLIETVSNPLKTRFILNKPPWRKYHRDVEAFLPPEKMAGEALYYLGPDADSFLDHLCKPDMEQLPTTTKQKDDFTRWKAAITRMSRLPNIYIKVSGGLSEMNSQTAAYPMPLDKTG